MQSNRLFVCFVKTVFIIGTITLSSVSILKAWTVSVLNPDSNYSSYDVFSTSNFSNFRSYLNDAGSILTQGALSNYNLGNSDAVIVNLHNSGGTLYTDTEIAVLKSLLESNVRVLVFGEHDSWQASNKQLASLVGGTYLGDFGTGTQGISSGLFPVITQDVNNVYFAAAGVVAPQGSNGISITDGNSITLWGANDNFLLFMDINGLADYTGYGDNDKLARNIANWLSGADMVIPEPSVYGLFAGLFLLGGSIIRRRR